MKRKRSSQRDAPDGRRGAGPGELRGADLALVTSAVLPDLVSSAAPTDRANSAELTDLALTGKALRYLSVLLQLAMVVLALRACTAGGAAAFFGAFFTLGVFLSVTSGNVGHELSHSARRHDHVIARLLFAMALHSAVALDHVYRHHIHVATENDPASARRGETLWRFFRRSYSQANAGAWRFERNRLRRKGLKVIGWRNRFLTGHAMELAYLALAWTGFGWTGLALAVLAALFAIRSIEGFNYVAHYGLVRVPGTRCEARHSWNARRLVSAGFTFNITSHSHHHLEPARPYWRLQTAGAVPMLPLGPAVMNLIAAWPGIWFRVMDPLLADWDATMASPGERALIARRARAAAAVVPVPDDPAMPETRSAP